MNNALINTAQINRARINSAKVEGVGIPSSRSDKPTLDSALKAKLVGVWSCCGKTNEDADRNIIRDRTGKGNYLEILNAGYVLNSGYGDYKENFSNFGYSQNTTIIRPSTVTFVNPSSGSNIHSKELPIGTNFKYKIRVTGLTKDANLIYSIGYANNKPVVITTDGVYEINETIKGTENQPRFYYTVRTYLPHTITIEQIPDHTGAFVTDGVEDVIISKKPVNEIIDNSAEFSIVSLWQNIKSTDNSFRVNVVRSSFYFIQNLLYNTGSYIGGYSYSTKMNNLGLVLGDKNNLINQQNGEVISEIIKNKLSVQGFVNSSGGPREISSIAYYGGFICKGVLTIDEINQIIAHYNLDWWIEPDGWYDIKKQGITNENHATFNDKLIDFSPNKRDLQANNFGWSGNSGVGKWITDFQSVSWTKASDLTVDGQTVIYNGTILKNVFILSIPYAKNISVPSFSVDVDFDGILYYYYFKTPEGVRSVFICKRGVNTVPASVASTNPSMGGTVGFYIDTRGTYAKIELVPEIEGGLWHDGIDDNCISIDKFPAYKDFTVVVDRYLEDSPANGAVVSKGATTGAFMYDYQGSRYQSFGGYTALSNIPKKIRKMSYLTKYSSLEVPTIPPGNNVDTEIKLSTGTFRSGDTRFSAFGLYGFLVYPYSMHPFLIERQLKKRKFGTLYPKT